MKGLVLEAQWQPKSDYDLTEFEKQSGKSITASSVWRYPKISLQEKPVPKIGPNDVLLKVKACGICGTDVHLVETTPDGYMLYPGLAKFPSVLGHELAGEVTEIGKDVKTLKVGDPVTVEEMNWCGHCTPCRNGFPNQCVNLEEIGITIDGGFEEYLAVDAKYCWKIDGFMDVYHDEDKMYEAGASVEPTCVAYNAVFEIGGGFRPGAYVAIFGAGPIGLAATALAKCGGASKVVVFEMLEERQKLAKVMGADLVLDPDKLLQEGTSPPEVLMDLTKGDGADFFLESAGLPTRTMPEITKALAVDSTIVQVGRAAEIAPLYIETLQVRRSRLAGAQGHSGHANFPNVIRLMSAGMIDMTKTITSRFALADAVAAIEKAGQRGGAKVMIKP